ncbi:D-amino-acid oxidase [Rugosimonospora africana]|uniref:D-amino-acid oxidase n=1 Tax=Rugosimonospora africana TaxID=556532 RepID=A0A8J3QXF1_9ACTN|nr:D-amino-acid oxidase [Rugosimonospora africana]
MTVVGAGVIGLNCGWQLAQAGHRVRIVAEKPPAESTSAVAAALWYPYRAYPREQVTRWSARTYQALTGLADQPGNGVRLRRGRELFRKPAADPWWIEAVPELERVPPAELPPSYVDGFALTVPVVDMPLHLAWLVDRLVDAGVTIEPGRVDALGDLAGSADVVVNCAGLGAGALVPDAEVTPVRGQVVVVAQFGLTEWLLDQADEEQLTYVVPREDTVVLGGTAQEGEDGIVPVPATARSIVRRCAELVPAVAGATVLAHRVGLRPARPAVRLAAETPGGGCPVVHCYGHGGAGVTLAYGCAEEVVSLVGSLG